MTLQKEELFRGLSDAVVAMDEEKTVELAGTVIADKIDPYEAIEKGLSHGMEKVGRLFEEEEYFVPELLICSDAMYAGLEVLEAAYQAAGTGKKHRVVIGVIEGDTHDIGKNLVKIMLEASRFEVFDLGRDVPPARFVEKANEVEADLIAISTLMTTTMEDMGTVMRSAGRRGHQGQIPGDGGRRAHLQTVCRPHRSRRLRGQRRGRRKNGARAFTAALRRAQELSSLFL